MKKEQNRTLTRGDMHDFYGFSVLWEELYEHAASNYSVDRLPLPNAMMVAAFAAILWYERKNKKEAK